MSFILSSQDVRITQEPASIGARMLALLIDSLFFVVYYYVIILLEDAKVFIGMNTYSYVLLFLVPWFYPLLSEIMANGQTLGKRLMHIRVADLEGGAPKVMSFVLRWFMLPFDLFAACGLGELCVLFTKRQQRLGDLAAGTWVVRTQTYAKEKFSLADYTPPSDDYVPRYPKASNLTPQQAAIIADTLRYYYGSDKVKMAAFDLAQEVEAVVGPSKDDDIRQFLCSVLLDYRCKI